MAAQTTAASTFLIDARSIFFGRFSNSSPHALVRQPNSINLHLCLSNDFIYMAVCISVLGGEYSLPIQ